LIGGGHDYDTIIDRYTMAHINHFLQEVGNRERRKFKESVIAARWAGATQQSYDNFMRHLRQSERQVQQAQATQKGQRFMTYEESIRLEQQRHVKFNELSAEEQSRLTAERESLWGQIPAHIQAKSRKLAGR
jgi:hypothetical protein